MFEGVTHFNISSTVATIEDFFPPIPFIPCPPPRRTPHPRGLCGLGRPKYKIVGTQCAMCVLSRAIPMAYSRTPGLIDIDFINTFPPKLFQSQIRYIPSRPRIGSNIQPTRVATWPAFLSNVSARTIRTCTVTWPAFSRHIRCATVSHSPQPARGCPVPSPLLFC